MSRRIKLASLFVVTLAIVTTGVYATWSWFTRRQPVPVADQPAKNPGGR